MCKENGSNEVLINWALRQVKFGHTATSMKWGLMKLLKLMSPFLSTASMQQQGTFLQAQQLLPGGMAGKWCSIVKRWLSCKVSSDRCSASSPPIMLLVCPRRPPRFSALDHPSRWYCYMTNVPRKSALWVAGPLSQNSLLLYPLHLPSDCMLPHFWGSLLLTDPGGSSGSGDKTSSLYPWLLSQSLQCCCHWD